MWNVSRVLPCDVREDGSRNPKAEWFSYSHQQGWEHKEMAKDGKQLGRDASHIASKHNSGPSSPCAPLHFQEDGEEPVLETRNANYEWPCIIHARSQYIAADG